MVKRIVKWSLISVAALLILALVLALVLTFWHLPRYIFGGELVALGEDTGDNITLMSTNVRCYAPLDLFEKSWFYRAELIVRDINRVRPDIIGFQEATFMHYGYLKEAMPDYDSEIHYRDDFVLSEGCPIFYRRDKFEKVDSGSFWLS